MADVEFWTFGPHAGYRVVWYRDDDGGSGCGDNPQVCFFYADNRAEAERLAKDSEPPENATPWATPSWHYGGRQNF